MIYRTKKNEIFQLYPMKRNPKLGPSELYPSDPFEDFQEYSL